MKLGRSLNGAFSSGKDQKRDQKDLAAVVTLLQIVFHRTISAKKGDSEIDQMDHRRKSKRVAKNGGSSHQAEKKQIMEQEKKHNLHFLDLPEHIPYNILSRLPLEKIFQFKSVCKSFSKIISDPYFSGLHLSVATKTTPSLIVHQDDEALSNLSMFILDFDHQSASLATSSSMNARATSGLSATNGLSGDNHATIPYPFFLTRRNVKLSSFIGLNVTTVGSCNGLVCYCDTKSSVSYGESLYYVCNPLLGEYTILPHPSPSTPYYTYLNHSGFGFCSKSKKYKVIRFVSKKTVDGNMKSAWTPMADIHTLGTQSWRRIGGARVPKLNGSFDAHLNGSLHWITDTQTPSDLIFSFDLYTEKFREIPPPVDFKQNYINKISGIKIGSLNGCLCVTYISEDIHFMVWVMKEYGVRESWTKNFSIDINSFTGLKVHNFNYPIRFSHNGDLWLLTRLDSVISYSPEKKSFKELRTLGTEWRTRVITHVPSLISLKTVVVDHHKICSMGSFTSLLKKGPFLICWE